MYVTRSWRKKAEKVLTGHRALRFLSTVALQKVAQDIQPSLTDNTLHRLIKDLQDAGSIIKIRRGFYANMRTIPQVVPAEAAQYLFPGSVVSLQYVLGSAGVINNPPRAITFVAPIREEDEGRLPPTVKAFSNDFGEYRVHALPMRFFDGRAGARSDTEDPSSRFYRRATPEKALVDWLYLSATPRSRSRLTFPPMEVDLDDIDMDRLFRLAGNLGVGRQTQLLIQRAHMSDDEGPEYVGPGM